MKRLSSKHLKSTALATAFLGVLCASVSACNIPVFRYALERWKPDVSEIVVFVDAALAKDQTELLKQYGYGAEDDVANRSIKFKLVDVQEPLEGTYGVLFKSVNLEESVELPYLVVRNSHRYGPVSAWQGPLKAVHESHLLDSPVRQELGRRLLAGHSIVWLMLESNDEEKNALAKKRVQEQCDALSSSVTLPEGIGLPGSELFATVPLYLKFSLLEVDRNDKQEEFLVKMLSGYQPEALADGEPLLVPVFGRGRALEVIPADQLDDQLVADLTQFLCAACSCQVKEQNPGFDLLLSVDWDKELFGEEGLQPPMVATGDARPAGQKTPKLLTIPSGKK